MKTISTTYRAIAFSFILFLGGSLFLPSLIFLNFKINQISIAANDCEQKDIVESNCKGKCQLMKSLSKVEKSSSDKENYKLTILSELTVLFCSENLSYSIFSVVSLKEKLVSIADKTATGFYLSLIKPPIV